VEKWAAVLGRMVDGIVARTHAHELLLQFDAHAGVPVVNALTDLLHPCQAVADAFTTWEHAKRKGLPGAESAESFFALDQRWVWLGDGSNVAHSLILTAASLGVHLVCATPKGREPDPKILDAARAIHPRGELGIEVTSDARLAVTDASVVHTDTWVSYGQEGQMTREGVEGLFGAYRVDAELMARANPDAIFMHCLPAHVGDEVTAEVLRGPKSVVIDQAENRLWTTRAILAHHVFA
jgi:ornithine carbamoyltransferase